MHKQLEQQKEEAYYSSNLQFAQPTIVPLKLIKFCY